MRGKPLILKQQEDGCVTPMSHNLNVDRKNKAKEYWLQHKDVTGTKLAEIFGVSFSAGCKWLRDFKV